MSHTLAADKPHNKSPLDISGLEIQWFEGVKREYVNHYPSGSLNLSK